MVYMRRCDYMGKNSVARNSMKTSIKDSAQKGTGYIGESRW